VWDEVGSSAESTIAWIWVSVKFSIIHKDGVLMPIESLVFWDQMGDSSISWFRVSGVPPEADQQALIEGFRN
jgi:hypothetical protein